MQIHRSDLKAEKLLGAGQFGEVYLAHHTVTTPQRVTVVKRGVKMLKGSATPNAKAEFTHECTMMVEAGPHPNVVQMVGVALQQAPWLCVLEFIPYGDLQGVLQSLAANKISLKLKLQLHMAKQLCDGCAHLTSKRLVHMWVTVFANGDCHILEH